MSTKYFDLLCAKCFVVMALLEGNCCSVKEIHSLIITFTFSTYTSLA